MWLIGRKRPNATGRPRGSEVDAEATVKRLVKSADVRIGGSRPWDIEVHNPKFYKRALSQGSLGLGESYMDGWWDTGSIDQLFDHILRADLEKSVRGDWRLALAATRAYLFNLQSLSRAFQVGEQHYDLGNDLYQAMLDSRMVYSCAYWKDAKTLDDAQLNKLDLICRKLKLEPGMKLLDIGCGWGGLLKYAAEKYHIQGVGLTVSIEQAKLAKQRCKGLPIDIRVQDYRLVKGEFDRVVSVGMFEHVGYKNYETFMKTVHSVLIEGGLMLLHTIASNDSMRMGDPWLVKYIFPNGMLPSISQIGHASEKYLKLEDWHNFGPDYDKTLMAWAANFKAAWPQLKDNYDDRFYRMWTFYLGCVAGGFRSRTMQLWQIVFSKGRISRYESIR